MNYDEIPMYLKCQLVTKLDMKHLTASSMNEGIDLEYSPDSIRVAYNPKHSRGVNAALEDNPTKFDLSVPVLKIQDGVVPVYSILQRTPMKVVAGSADGNPLVYAFKGENGYSFKSNYDKKTIQDAVDAILKKFAFNYFSAVEGDVATIVCPSENSLNQRFAYAFRKIAESMGKTINMQEDVLVKYPVDDIRREIVDDLSSDLNKWLLSLPKQVAMKKRVILDKALDKMDVEHNGTFAYHYIKDVDIRKHISTTMKLSTGAKSIEGENVIVLDDTVSQGKTLVEACQILYEAYLPKSVVALTMFSPLKT